ncbi:unnamed protein product [Cuscuta campestris]|uniref:Pectinesterase inhibitor domain-containing protein n=1 Tax=Cuscuta campestris TaxID=132261 RepID=A0A484KCN0_9ASTE|nr:unnamed protein product [Cuscuta campestris]
MAFHHTNIITIFFGILLLPLFSFTNVHGDPVDDVCAKAQQHSLCLKVLRADPRSKNADLKTLGFVTIDAMTNEVKSGLSLAQLLLSKVTDPRQKSPLSACVDSLGHSIMNLEECSGSWRSGDLVGVNIQASTAAGFVQGCDRGFSDHSIPEPPQLKDSCSTAQWIDDIISVISNLSRPPVAA